MIKIFGITIEKTLLGGELLAPAVCKIYRTPLPAFIFLCVFRMSTSFDIGITPAIRHKVFCHW